MIPYLFRFFKGMEAAKKISIFLKNFQKGIDKRK